MNSMKIVTLLAVFASPFAVAQDEPGDGEEEDASAERVCIYPRNVRNFNAIDDRHLYVREGSDGHYLLTMRSRCIGLRNAMGIAFRDTSSRTCSDGFGEIVYRDRMAGGGRMESCRIDTIEKVEGIDDAKESVAARREADN